MNIGQWYVSRGRIDRPTFWLRYFVPILVASIVASVIDALIGTRSDSGVGVVSAIVGLLTIVPSISSTVTRLHDRGHSAWWILWNLLPIAGFIVLLVQYCSPGEAGPNRYGPPPAPAGGPVGEPGYPQTFS